MWVDTQSLQVMQCIIIFVLEFRALEYLAWKSSERLFSVSDKDNDTHCPFILLYTSLSTQVLVGANLN